MSTGSNRDHSNTVVCNCADVPPTMPTARTEHLWDCPVADALRWQEYEARRLDGSLEREFAPIREAMYRGDTETVAKWLSTDNEAKARAAYLRSRWTGNRATSVETDENADREQGP